MDPDSGLAIVFAEDVPDWNTTIAHSRMSIFGSSFIVRSLTRGFTRIAAWDQLCPTYQTRLAHPISEQI
jgi:hypothetical protein